MAFYEDKMKKINLKKMSIVIILVILVIFCVLYSVFPIIYGKLYSGNHIKIDLSIYYEGNQINIDDLEVKCVNPQNQVSQIEKDGSEYSVKGGTYGKYTFILTIPGTCIENGEEDIIIELQYLNSNDWYISDSKCMIDIRNVNGLVSCNCKINTKYNDGTTADYSEEKETENGNVKFSWGI